MMSRPKILAVLAENPFPASDGKSYPIAAQLAGLAADWQVDILEVHRPGRKHGFESRTHQDIATNVFQVNASAPRTVRRRMSDEMLFGKPFFVEPAVDVSELKQLNDQRYDVVYVSPSNMSSWAQPVAQAVMGQPRLVINLNDSVTDRFRRDYDLFRRRVLSFKTSCKHLLQSFRALYMGRLEQRLLAPFDRVLVQTEKDKQAIIKDCGSGYADKLRLAPNGIKESLLDLQYTPQQAASQRLLHIGAVARNRGDLVYWFINKVFRPLQAKLPDVTFQLAGKVSEKDRAKLQEVPGVEVLGFVDSVEEVLATASMSIAPLFMRTGLVNKVLDSMAAGVPCSGASVFNGFTGFSNGHHGFDVADAKQWQQVLLDTLQDPQRLMSVSKAGRELVSQHFRWQDTIDSLNQDLLDLLPQSTVSTQVAELT